MENHDAYKEEVIKAWVENELQEKARIDNDPMDKLIESFQLKQ